MQYIKTVYKSIKSTKTLVNEKRHKSPRKKSQWQEPDVKIETQNASLKIEIQFVKYQVKIFIACNTSQKL